MRAEARVLNVPSHAAIRRHERTRLGTLVAHAAYVELQTGTRLRAREWKGARSIARSQFQSRHEFERTAEW